MTVHEDLPLPLRVPGKEVRKASAFDTAQNGNSQLMPLFPYLTPGSIVPTTAAMQSDGSPRVIGYFVHTNTVDEVVVTLGGEGRNRTGDIYVGGKTHGVGGDASIPFFALQIITQRQLEEGEQPEALTFQCEKCNVEVYRHEFGIGGIVAELPRSLPTTTGSFEAAEAWNASEARRCCPKCGHQNGTFPLPFWGWGNHVRTSRITKLSREALKAVVTK